jgi:histone deacetylase 1/2
LEKSLYGISQAPKLWNDHITGALKDLGFRQSIFDECLFYRKDMMVVLYVDDAGIAAPTKELVDELVQQLRHKGFELTVEGSFSEFLGIKFTQREDGSIEMTQQGLINKILQALDMENSNPNWTPARADALGKDEQGQPMQELWNYRSIVGMMLYLSTNSRPDITYAVSQIARFSYAPKQSHARAVKMIARYLARTKDKGTIVTPSKVLHLDLYCDADYAGLYGQEEDRDSNSSKSRAGYIILLSGCPVVWKSSLIQEITLSTLESEYVALSKSLRILLPLKRLLKEMCEHVGLPQDYTTTIRASVFEDNQGAFLLAKNHRLTNRTKYLLTKWHWFWSHYKNKEFDIYKCPTTEQRADFMTKGLTRELFENNRRPVQGW